MADETVDVKYSTLQWWHATIATAAEHGIECGECASQLDTVLDEIQAAIGEQDLEEYTHNSESK